MSSSESDEFEIIDQLEASLSPKELLKVQAWLQPTDYNAQSSEFYRHLSSQAPGTGLWICETSKYQQWQESKDHGSLWIKGVPGAGKSVITASMIQHFQKTEGVPVLYFFFRYIILANRRPRGLIQDFLAQLLPYSSRLQAVLQPLTGSPLDDFSDELLWEYLLTGLSSIEKAYCVVDALDEMELLPKDGFLDRLNGLAKFRPNAIKILMTSRPKQYLQSSLRDASIVHISLEDDLVGKDISVFLSYRLNTLLPYDDQKTFRESLICAISERSNGLFLYARLLLDQIIPSLKLAQLDIDKLVNNLPVGLEEIYNNMLSQQAKSLKINVRIQVFLLELATHSSRALRLNEMASVLASSFPASMLPDVPKVIARSACAPLLEILEDETVSIIHHSFTEFLLNQERIGGTTHGNTQQFPILNTNIIHKKLSIICIDYLRSGGLRVDEIDTQSKAGKKPTNRRAGFLEKPKKIDDGYNYQESKLRHPFLEYAVGNWAFHASKYDFEDNEFFKSVASFMDSESTEFKKWLELEWMKEVDSSKIQAPTPLHVAAFAGLTQYAKKLLKEDASVDALDAEDRMPLHWACARGHASMVSLLLTSGATADAEDIRGVKPIHEAARKNHSRIVQMLLEAGVDPLTPKTKENIKRMLLCGEISTKGETAVEYAWLQGHTNTIITMLPFLTTETLEELFCQCCRYGKFEAVRAILKATGLSPNSKSSGATALYLACRAQSVAIVELLVAKGADVNQPSKWVIKNRNACGSRVYEEPLSLPIHGVVKDWNNENDLACKQILRVLLNAGADIEAKDASGNTPLLSLFDDRHSENLDIIIVNGLLQAGANVLAADDNGDSVLHRCLQFSHNIQILKLLLEFGASVDVIGKDGNTVLHAALQNYSGMESQCLVDAVKLILEKGARCDVKNSDGCTAIEEAACSWRLNLEAFTILLQFCSDADAIQRCMWKLSPKKEEEIIGFIRLLQSFGASLEDRDSNGATILLTSMRNRELFEAFLECGSDIHAVDAKGRGALHYFVSCSPYDKPLDCLQRLGDMINRGLDPIQTDLEGNNLLHEVAKNYTGGDLDDLFVQKFFDYGLSVNSKNKRGMTPLHVFFEKSDVHTFRNSVSKSLDERFHERHQIPLLNLFRRSSPEIYDIDAQDSEGVTIFHLAALRSETQMFYLLGEGADPNILTKEKRNALHLACRARQSNVVGYLCQTYSELINQRDSYGRTPLHDACTSGRPESVRLLLRAGADTNILDNNMRTPLHACAEFADEEKIWALLSRPNQIAGNLFHDRFRPVNKSPTAYEPWYMAERVWQDPHFVEKDGPSVGLVVKALLSAGSDVMATDTNRRTPLDLAIEYDCGEMIDALKFSAKLLRKKWHVKSKDRRLPAILALKKPNRPLLSTMEPEDPSLREILENLSKYLHLLTSDDIEWISQHGENIMGVDSSKSLPLNQSLLHIAASKGFIGLVEGYGPLACVNDDSKSMLQRIHEQLSIDSGYNPELKSLAPILHVACARELPNIEMVEILVEICGVDVNARSVAQTQKWAHIKDAVEGGTALHVLAKANYWWQLKALRYLLRKGANVDAINEKGETPLHIACINTTYAAMNCENDVYGYWRIECVRLLLDSGANINVLDNKGLSCLHKASSSPQIMRILLEHGADINAGSYSPVFSAIQIQCLEGLTILLDAGISPNVVDPHTNNDGFELHYKVKDTVRPALLCAAFSDLHNQRPKHSAPMVKLLIERGADLYTRLNDKEILVHYVFENAVFEIVLAFLDSADKIDFNARDPLGRTVFHAACEWVECLHGYRHLHWEPKAIAPFIRTLDFGANPLLLDNKGRNALHILFDNAEMEEEAIIQFLALDISKKLLYQKDGNGFTPLNSALRFLRPAAVEALIGMGIDLLSADPTGATALHQIAAQCLAARPQATKSVICEYKPEFYSGTLALWKRFLALGGSINVRDNQGAPPLFCYLSSYEIDDYKLPENFCCHVEKFPIYFSEEVVTDLDLQAKNMNGENALHIIAKRDKDGRRRGSRNQGHDHEPTHDKELYQFFVRKGLNPLEEDGKGRTSLDVAAACEQKGILELFQYGK